MDTVPELLVRPRGLVKIFGLDLQEKSGPHQEVWAALTQGRTPESVPLAYQLVTNPSTVFPKRKTKKRQDTNVTDDDVVPLGILKSNWVNKHRSCIPSVVVIFFDLDWQSEDWATREAECAKTINELRTAMDGRFTRLVAVLMLQNPLEDGHPLVEERAVSLRNACLLKTKSSLFALPSGDPDLREMVVRLESAFFELSNKYYEQAEVHVRKRMDLLNLNTETILAVRYNFKIAYFNELRQLRQAALKSYSQAYTLLRDTQAPGVALSEVKSVEGVLMAKICQIQFGMQTPVDALKQFREHLVTYRNRDGGKKALAFRHSAWLSEQYFMFGVVFEEAVRAGLQALQTEHPGFYFFQAAQHAQLQKEAVEIQLAEFASIEAKIEAKEVEYIGQTNIEVTDISNPDDLPLDDNELFNLLMGERVQNHAQTIVNLCTRAVEQFKKIKTNKKLPSKTDRSVNQINLFCAEAHFELGHYKLAKETVEKAINMFRRERWCQLLATTLRLAHRVAYHLNDARAIAAYSLELAGGVGGCISDDDRSKALVNLQTIVTGGIPQPLSSATTTTPTSSTTTTPPPLPTDETVTWVTSKAGELPLEPLIMNGLRDCIDCKVCFEKKSVLANEDIVLVILFRSSLLQPITISGVTPTFSNAEYNDAKVTLIGEGDTLKPLEPNTTYVLKMQLRTCLTTTHKLSCKTIAFNVGDEEHMLSLRWNVDTVVIAQPTVSIFIDRSLNETMLNTLDWESIPNLSALKIKQLPARVSISCEHEKPALVNEVYEIKVNVQSEEVLQMSKVKLQIKVMEEGKLCTHANVLQEAQPVGNVISLDLDPIAVGTLTSKTISLRFNEPCMATVFIDLQYYTATAVEGDDGHWERNATLEEPLSVVIPVTTTFNLESLQRAELPRTPGTDQTQRPQQAYAGDNFLLNIQIVSNVPWPIEMTDMTLELFGDEISDKYPFSHQDQPTFASRSNGSIAVIHPHEVLSDCSCMLIPTARLPRGIMPLGHLRASWKRLTATETTESLHTLPDVNVLSRDISVHVDVVPFSHIRQPTVVTYTIKNHSAIVQELQIQVDQSKTFLYSGCQRAIIKLLPGSMNADGRVGVVEKQIAYNVFPLVGGSLALPTMHVKSLRTGEVISTIAGPRFVFVKDNPRESKMVEEVEATQC